MNILPAYFLISYLVILYVVYHFFFFKRHKNLLSFVKSILLPITILGGFSLYYYGYHEAHPDNGIFEKAYMAIYSTARLLILGNDLIEIQKEVHESPLLFQLFSMVMITAFIIFASLFLHLFGQRLRNRLRIRFTNPQEVFIFIGINEEALTLANHLNINRNKRLIIFVRDVIKNENTDLYEVAKHNNALILSRESLLNKFLLKNEESIINFTEEIHLKPDYNIFQDHSLFVKLGIKRLIRKNICHFFFFTGHESLNIHIARIAANEISKIKPEKEITLHIRTLSDELKDEYDRYLPEDIPSLSIRFFDDSDIAVRHLIQKYPPHKFVDIDTSKALATSDFHAMIIGFGMIGSAALRKLIELGQFPGSSFKAIVTDKVMDSLKGRFLNRYPGLKGNYDIEFVQTEMGHENFFELVKKHIHKLNYIVVALGNDSLNIQVALDIKRLALRHHKTNLNIIAYISNNENYRDIFANAGQLKDFGRNNEVFTEEIVVRDSIERTARRIHEYYYAMAAPEKSKRWNALPRIKQLANISAAEHMDTKLAMAGLTKEYIHALKDKNNFEKEIGKERLINLAKGEHLRWNGLYFTNGWTTWELKDIPARSFTSNEILKLHACLVEWEQMEEINKYFQDDFFKYDIENVINLYDLIKMTFTD